MIAIGSTPLRASVVMPVRAGRDTVGTARVLETGPLEGSLQGGLVLRGDVVGRTTLRVAEDPLVVALEVGAAPVLPELEP
jgi:hypothetical protein